jgi:hypothetical protein
LGREKRKKEKISNGEAVFDPVECKLDKEFSAMEALKYSDKQFWFQT